MAAASPSQVRAGQGKSTLLKQFSQLCVPITSSTSCDQPIFVDHATDLSLSSDAVQARDRLAQVAVSSGAAPLRERCGRCWLWWVWYWRRICCRWAWFQTRVRSKSSRRHPPIQRSAAPARTVAAPPSPHPVDHGLVSFLVSFTYAAQVANPFDLARTQPRRLGRRVGGILGKEGLTLTFAVTVRQWLTSVFIVVA